MKLTKAFYFIAFLLAINVLVPGSNNYVEAKPKGKGGNSLANKIKNNKAAVISTILTTLALAAAGTYGALHYHKKGAPKKKPVAQNAKAAPAPAPVADNRAAPKPAGTTTPTRAYPPAY